MLTPAKYWRVACELNSETPKPPSSFVLPSGLAIQAAPPARGHGITIAAYDRVGHTGMLRWIGIVIGVAGTVREVEWKSTEAQIWVDTGKGRSFWDAGDFAFAAKKIADYGLHELWQHHFDNLELRACTPTGTKPIQSRSSQIAPERLNPIEVVGEPSNGARSGVVYVLKSAYGYKVGRTRDVPSRMRAFGVQLPFIYTIPFCVWFEDCHEAERRYHDIFAAKRINGEWFDLDQNDVQQIRFKS